MSASSPSISKRLHISGLTPSITPADLATRFQAFGVNATSVEGFNKLDALGRPRGYGYVQVVGKEEGVKRCITSLSGTTWKGAKLRIGDAKPDFRERLERDRNTEPKPRVKRRRINAIHAPITDLVNPDVAKSKKGYHVTETGRVVTVVRMRPAHPLGPTADAAKSIKVVKGGKVKKEKRGKEKKRDPSNRARRRTIDMVRYGSVYLKGAWLGEGGTVSRTQVESEAATVAMEGSGAESSGNSDTEEEISGVEERTEDGSSASSSEYEESEDEESPVTQPISTLSARSTSHATAAPSTSDDFAQEKTRTLGLLQSLFGEGDDWGGRESVSDIEIEDGRVQVDSVPGEEEEGGEDENEDEEMEDAEEVQQLVHVSTAKDREDVSQEEESEKKPTKLKDLFAPREEEGASNSSVLLHYPLNSY
ncbi:hypothetical protein OE88DRAFT_1503997 [Heliocybe sulcata]|uniref:RRM domain-containing protein n=1 Tax=Heliocybe sulcata TaxID=5364 RepID=A0A5C3N4A9_9AGAM|nr:hypothetical protein OE88DRAFT_1503997 [Heliocybe sulcata]